MTPKEKANELFNKYIKILGGINSVDWVYFHGNEAKQCALIAVNEIIDNYGEKYIYCLTKIYWEEVKYEIELL